MSTESTSPPPASVSDCLGNEGTPHVLRWNGRDYPVASPCPAVIERVEKHVVRSAMDALAENKDTFTPAEYAAETKSLSALVRNRQNRPGGELWAAELNADGGFRGMVVLLWACLAEGHTDAKTNPPTLDDVYQMHMDTPEEVELAAAVLTPDFLQAAAVRQKLPPAAAAKQVADAKAKLDKMTAEIGRA